MKVDDFGAWPKTEDELTAYLRQIVADVEAAESADDGYNKSAEALALGSVATFNYLAHVMGNTGFQAGYAALKFLGIVNGYGDTPFGILNGEHLLYPQYDLEAKAREWIAKWRVSLAPVARKKMADADQATVHPAVWARWEEIAALDEATP